MIDTELNIRNYFKTFTAEDLANSIYLFDINFDTVPIESIMQALNSLYEEVKDLKAIIDRDFQSQNGELLPKNPMIQSTIIQDCYKKEAALLKSLSNSDVYNEFVKYKLSIEKEAKAK